MKLILVYRKTDGRIGLLFRYISDNEWGAVCYDNGGWVWKNGAGEYGSFGELCSFRRRKNTIN